MLLFFVNDLCKCFLFSCFVFVYFIFLICIMHSAFNLFVFPNYMLTSLLLFVFFINIFYERAMRSPEIALKNNHYYYYYYYVTTHLQRIQHYAARVILRFPKLSSITIHLKSLHWLPVKVRSTFKIACLCYHCHNSTAPSYVTCMLHRKPLHTRNTPSSSYTMPLLNRPAHSKATLGDRAFSFASSSVWNSILNDVRCAPSLSSFKSRLKTYLFRSVYKD